MLSTIAAIVALVCCRAVASGAEPGETHEEIRPLLAKYCLDCHGERQPEAGLNLASLEKQDAFQQAVIAHFIRQRLAKGEMPPADEAQPTAAEKSRLLEFSQRTVSGYTLDGQTDPGPLHPRRLNAREHMNIFRDLAIAMDRPQPRRATYETKKDGSVNLYHAIIPPQEHPCDFVTRVLPPDTADGGFDSIGENLSIPPFLMEKYFRASSRLLDDCFSPKGKDEHGRYQWRLRELADKAGAGPLPRGVETRRDAVLALLQDFASRAFRRPVSPEEAQRYLQLFDASQAKGVDFETSIRLALQAVLVSPRFVILWADEPAHESSADPERSVRPLDDYELASRLSIFLWSSVPDRELVQLAQDGRLQDEEVLEQQVRRMLADQRVTDGFHAGFICQWLQLDLLDRNAPDAEQYPQYFQENLAELMKQELLLFTDVVLVEDRSILQFIDADWGLVCYPLAQHYGLSDFPGKKSPSNAAPPWYRVKFDDQRRGGLLTMGKVLTGTSQPARTSPVHRGKWVLETILGAPPPPPPQDVDNVLKGSSEGENERLTVPQLLARHRDNAACYACHRRIDPLGMALENFDPTGRWRDTDQQQPIDARGELVDGAKFHGVEEFKALIVSRKDEFARCFVEKMLAYALGRKLQFYDEPTVQQIVQAVAEDDYKFSRVVVEVAKSYPFRHRRTR